MVKDGDRIVVDSEQKAINWLVDEAEQVRRKQEWDASDKGLLQEKRGVLFRYARDVAVSPMPGAVTAVWHLFISCSPPVLVRTLTEINEVCYKKSVIVKCTSRL